jgi:hypothetical protein
VSEGLQLALEAVEASVQHLVAVRDYSRLKDMAEASAVAGQVRFFNRPLQWAPVCPLKELRSSCNKCLEK